MTGFKIGRLFQKGGPSRIGKGGITLKIHKGGAKKGSTLNFFDILEERFTIHPQFTHRCILNIRGQIVLHVTVKKPDNILNVSQLGTFQHKNHLEAGGFLESKRFEEGLERR